MGYWTSKVLPKIKKAFAFEKNGKKAAAAEACKSFDDSKEEISKELDEKKAELHPKVTEIYEATSTEIKTLVKERTDAGVKKHSVAVTKFLEELVKIEFPGSKPASEAATNFGPALVSGPVLFVFEKVSTFVVTEDAPAASAAEEGEAAAVEEEKKVEEIEKAEEVTATPPATEAAEAAAAAETPAEAAAAPKA